MSADRPHATSRGKRDLSLRVAALLLAALSVACCATAPPGREPAGEREARSVAQTGASPAGRSLRLPSSIGPIAATVRLGASPDRIAGSEETWQAVGALEGSSLFIGLLLTPTAAPLILGGTALVVATAAMYGTERHQVRVVEQALRESNLPGALESSLGARSLGRASGEQPVAGASIEVLGWGLAGRSASDRQCFVAAVKLSVQRDDGAVDESILRIAPGAGTEGAPPPQCASLGRFADDGGRLVRDTARDYAEVLAVLIVERLWRIER